MGHIPVLLEETLDALDIHPGEVVLDGTVNRAGHAQRIAEILGATGILVGLDRDGDAITAAKETLRGVSCRVILREANYRNLDVILREEGIEAIDKALFDLGLSSNQLDDSGRGFSFQKDEPLTMTFESNPGEESLTARDILNSWSEETLADVIYGYGGEQFSRRIAKAIVLAREETPIERTSTLSKLVEEVVPKWYRSKRIHPATKTFQAIRIAVNDELGAVKEGISKAWKILRPGGVLAIITFHELEDRIVKSFFKERFAEGTGEIKPRKGFIPSEEEVKQNPRARSARLRICKKK